MWEGSQTGTMSTRYRESQYILDIVQRCAPRMKEVAKCKTMSRKLPSLYRIPTLVWPSVPKLIFSIENCFSVEGTTKLSHFCYIFLAPSGALIAIPTYYWPSTHPTFSDHTGPQHWTFTFWATTAISRAITRLICWLHGYLMCMIVQDNER